METEKRVSKPEDGIELPKTPEIDSSENWEKDRISSTSEDSPRPVISVRKSEDLFGMVYKIICLIIYLYSFYLYLNVDLYL